MDNPRWMPNKDDKHDFTEAVGTIIGVAIVAVVTVVALIKFCQWAF